MLPTATSHAPGADTPTFRELNEFLDAPRFMICGPDSILSAPGFTLCELRELEVPLPTALLLTHRTRATQVWAIRKLAGFPYRPSPAVGLTARVDHQGNVLSIDRR